MLKLFIVVVLVGVAAGVMLAVVNASLPSGYIVRVSATATIDRMPDGRLVALGKILVTCSGDCSSAIFNEYEIIVRAEGGGIVTVCDNIINRPLSPGLNTVPFACFELFTPGFFTSEKYTVSITATISGNIYRATVVASG